MAVEKGKEGGIIFSRAATVRPDSRADTGASQEPFSCELSGGEKEGGGGKRRKEVSEREQVGQEKMKKERQTGECQSFLRTLSSFRSFWCQRG